MADSIPHMIDINAAPVRELTQLPGIAVNLARAIVNHRQRHGYFSAFEELRQVKHFPVERLDEIRQRAVLGNLEDSVPPRHLDKSEARVSKKTAGNTKALRATRGKDRSHDTTGHRPSKTAA